MKKRIYCLFLLLTLLFIAGCNKDNTKTAPTPTTAATATPTPTPVNLAKANLDKLPAAFDKVMSYQKENAVDTSKGIGYDVNLNLSLGSQIISLLGLEGLENISLSGTYDTKNAFDAFAADLTLSLNTSEIINALIYADATSLMFNLPKYSTSFASATWEELLTSADAEIDVDGLLNSFHTEAAPSDEELFNILRSNLEKLTACFKPVDGITENVTIGTGDYTLNGDKYTVRADKNDLLAVLKSLEAELSLYVEDLTFHLEELEASSATAFTLEYYTDNNGSYAWSCYPDNAAAQPVSFINTSYGFCLYTINESGAAEVTANSEKSSENSGIIYLLYDEEGDPTGFIDYKYSDNTFYFDAELDTIEIKMDGSTINDTISYDMTIVMDGISVVLKQKSSKDHTELTCTLASYGIEYGTLEIISDARDYAEASTPQNTTDITTWVEGLDQDTLVADLLQLLTDYPFLMDLLGAFDDTSSDFEDDPSRNEGSFELPTDYTDDFIGMTGYQVDNDGYVDFEPSEDEVLAAGRPSTGYETLALTDDQKQRLSSLAEAAFPGCDKSISSYYWVWGNASYNNVLSYYSTEYDFTDSENWDNNIALTYDAVSGEFISVDIYHSSKDEALRIANEMFAVLGGTYTITAEMAEEYTYTDDGFAFTGYDSSLYGGSYYNVGISVYNSDFGW